MRLLFVHDNRFIERNGKFFSSGSFPSGMWERYLLFFDEVVVLGRKEPYAFNISGLSLSSHDDVTFELLDYLDSPLDLFRHRKRLEKDTTAIFEKCKIDAVVARLPSELGYRVMDVSIKYGIPIAAEVVASAIDAYGNYKFTPWYHPGNLLVKVYAPIADFFQKKYVKKASHVIYVTEAFLQQKYPSSSGAVIGYASNVELPSFDETVLSLRIKNIERKGSKLRFGMIGNADVHYKGYDIALRALNSIKNKLPNFVIFLVGGGKGDAIRKLAKELGMESNVQFLGLRKNGREIFEFLDSLDIYLHPSRTEGLPRALVEAMSRACPALASNVGGIPELLENNYLHEKGDFLSLGKNILELSESKTSQKVAAQKNFERAKKYTIPELTKRRNDFWGKFYSHINNYRA